MSSIEDIENVRSFLFKLGDGTDLRLIEKENYDKLVERIKELEVLEDYLKDKRVAIEAVLSMLKQNSAELAEKSAEIEKKDRIIDLMAKYINYLSDELVQTTGKNELEFCRRKSCKDSNYSCEQCIKKYFERKSKK